MLALVIRRSQWTTNCENRTRHPPIH